MNETIGDYISDFSTEHLFDQNASFERWINNVAIPSIEIPLPYPVDERARKHDTGREPISNHQFLECLSARKANVLLIGDSEERYILDAIGSSLNDDGLIQSLDETNAHNNYLRFTTTNGVRFRWIGFKNEPYTPGTKAGLLEALQSEKDWDNNVVMFGSLLWPLMYIKHTEPSLFMQNVLPHYFELFRSTLQVPHRVQMIWKTTHWSNQGGDTENTSATERSQWPYNINKEQINVFGNALAAEYGWDIVDDYSPSHTRIDQLSDVCHYAKGSSLMDYTMQMFRQRVCDWGAE